MKLNTIRNQMLAAFLLFTLLIVFLSSASFWYLRRGEDIRLVKTWIDKLHLNTLSLIKYDMSFFSHEMINDEFFQTGRSDHLQYREALLSEIQNNLNQLMSQEEVDFYSHEDIRFIDSLISRYDSTFSLIVKKTLKRGFKNYGLQGEMRRYALQLESPGSGITRKDADMLRRYEKDYFLKLDQFYVDELNDTSGDLLNDLNKKPQANKAAIELLTNYTDSFNRLVMLSRELGIEDNRGLKRKLDILSDYIATEFDSVSTNTSSRVDDNLRKVEITYVVTVVFCILLSILISYILAYKLSRPIIKLSRGLDDVISHDFENENKLHLESRTREIVKLEKAFENMRAKIKKQFDTIQENSKALHVQNGELKKINTRLRASERELKESAQVKDKFFSIIAHDLKGPIATQASFLNTLIKHIDGFTKEETKYLAKEMYASVNNLSTLLENLLEWSRSQMGLKSFKPKNVSLSEVVNKNIELMMPKANEKDIQLQAEVPKELEVFSDENMLHFILRNIVSNALKFTEPGGKVSIKAEMKEGQEVAISVIDNGIGISETDIEKLFKTGSKVSRMGTANEKGTGLGLMLCKEFVERHEGQISVESQKDKGTSFTFTLQPAQQNASSEEV